MQSSVWEDDPLRSLSLTKNDVLERVDEYSLYCHYLGYEPIPRTGRYQSPVRTDDDVPSFGIFHSTKSEDREFLWKDMANGWSGDIFKLVQLMFRYRTVEEAVNKIATDFGLRPGASDNREKLVYHKVPESFDIDIKIASRDFTKSELEYWERINVSRQILSDYYTTAIKYYWMTADQEYPAAPKEFAFAYRIWDKYQIYQPFAEKQFKFRNNFTEEYVPGLLQLKFNSPLLIITKSFKDIMFLRSIGLEAIAPRSETTPLNTSILPLLEKRYKHIVTLFDNDGKHKAEIYDYPELHIPIEIAKDPTDVATEYGVEFARELVYSMIEEYL